MSVRVRSVVMWRAECTEPLCPWGQVHETYENALADTTRHGREWHARSGDPLLTDDERQDLQNWVEGIAMGVWDPTPATKRRLAGILLRLLWADERGRA
jgi:hypothetical protein